MPDIFSETYYNNTVLDWSISFGAIIGSMLIGKIIYWFFGRVVKTFTAKTETKLDDMLIDVMEEPLVAILVIIGIWFSLGRLSFSDGVDNFISHLMYAAVILTITWLVVRVLDAFVEQYIVPLAEKTDTDFDDMILPVVRKATKVMIWVMGIIVALNNVGIQIGPLIAGLGIGGLALAMAAKDTIANFFGGFTIFTDKPFKVGDRIKLGGFDGSVYEVGLRSSRIRTLSGTMVTIPNARMADSMIENVSEEPHRKIVLTLGLVYDLSADQMQQAMDILKEIIKEENELLEENVTVGFTGFGDSALEILFIYYIKKGADIVGAQTNVNLKIIRRFVDNNLDFAYPTQTLYTKQV